MTVETGRLAPDAVRTMFDRIAPVYDVMNRAMTAGLDRRWRAETARAVVSPGDRVLDACCGTGDLAIAAQRAGGKVVKPAQSSQWGGYFGYFSDPDGYLWKVASQATK